MVQNIFNRRLKTINAESFQTDTLVLHERSSAHTWRSSAKARLWSRGWWQSWCMRVYLSTSTTIHFLPVSDPRPDGFWWFLVLTKDWVLKLPAPASDNDRYHLEID